MVLSYAAVARYSFLYRTALIAYFSWAFSSETISPVSAEERTTWPDMEVEMSHCCCRTVTERMAEEWRWVWVRRRVPARS